MSEKKLQLDLIGDQSIPMYQQIKNAITQKISNSEWLPGQLIPSENQLAEDLGISRMTINRPLRELTAEGLLRRVHGLGTFVAEPPRRAHLIELVSIAEEIQALGKTHRAKVLRHEEVLAEPEIAEKMQLAKNAKLYKIEIVHYQDELPIQLELRYVNPILVPGFINIDFNSCTTTEYLISQLRPEELEHVVQAIMPDKFISLQLDIPITEPCLKLSRRTWKNQHVVTVAELIYPSSRYELGDRFSHKSKYTN